MNFPEPSVLYFSQSGGGDGFSSDTVLSNPSDTHTAVTTIDFIGPDGDPLLVDVAALGENQFLLNSGGPSFATTSTIDINVPPLSSVTVSTSPDGDLAVGAAEVNANYPLGGVVRFSIPDIGIAGVGAGQPVNGFISPVRRVGGINTGVALHNIGSEPVDIDLSLRNLAEGEVATATIEDFPARGQTAKFIHELFEGFFADNATFEGSIVVRVTGGMIVATVLELGTQAGQFTTLPVTPLP